MINKIENWDKVEANFGESQRLPARRLHLENSRC